MSLLGVGFVVVTQLSQWALCISRACVVVLRSANVDRQGPTNSSSHPTGRARRLQPDAILDYGKRTMHVGHVALVTVPEHDRGDSASSRGHLLRRLLGLSWAYRFRVAWVFGLQSVLLVLTLAGMGLTGVAVDIVRRAVDPRAPAVRWPFELAPPVEWSSLTLLFSLGGVVVVLALLRALLTNWYELAAGKLVHVHIVPTLRSELFSRLARLSSSFFDKYDTASLVNRLTSDVQMLRSFVDGVLIQGCVLALSLAVFLTYMLWTHVPLTLLGVASTPVLVVVTRVFSNWAQAAYAENRRLSDGMVRAMTEGIEGITVTKLFGSERVQLERFAERSRAVRDQQKQIFVNVSRYTPGIDLLTRLNVCLVLGYGGYLVSLGTMSLGQLVVFAGLLQQFATRASNMALVVNTLQQSLAGARRVFEVFDARPDVRSPEHPVDLKDVRGDLEFDGVAFDYFESRGLGQAGLQQALSDISLRVPAGSCIGITGETGSGKSTLLQLVARFYDPRVGRVKLDGVDLRQLDLKQLRSCLGIVFQETFLFRDTVASNVSFGSPGASRSSIVDACKCAGAHEFIERLPDGYDTLLDERAINLSGGQRQRIALARALLPSPRVLLLDEPTSALDSATEAEVFSRLQARLRGCTTLIVSGRARTLERADTIIVLERGRVVESGSPQELVQLGGRYARIAALQRGLAYPSEGA